MKSLSEFLDYGILVILVVIITKIFGLFPFFGIPLNIVTPVITFVSLIYILLNWKYLSLLKNSILIKSWILLIAIIPYLFVVIHICLDNYNTAEIFRENGLVFTQLVLFCSSAILILKGGLKYLTIIGFIIFGIIAITFYLDYTFPFVFRLLKSYIYNGTSTLDASSFEDYQLQRASGFYFNPNAAGFALLNSFALLFPYLVKKRSFIISFILSICFVILIFLTGSRGTMLSIPIVIFLITMFVKNLLQTKNNFSLKFANFSILFIGVFLVVFFISSYLLLYNQLKDSKLSSLAKRIEVFIPNSDTNLNNDRSISHRLESQQRYLRAIIKSPILGYGSTHFNLLRKTEPDIVKSHNLYFEITYMYGIFYLLFYIFCIGLTFYYGISANNIMSGYTLMLFSLVLFIAGVSNSSIINYRFFVSTLGALIGFYYNTQYFKPQLVHK